ncbi:MAG TPA: S53 family peptidase [Ktedonobacteraceae bacterium]|nr:S53 family peptidase [Ktedonobacteraceae bacterium]
MKKKNLCIFLHYTTSLVIMLSLLHAAFGIFISSKKLFDPAQNTYAHHDLLMNVIHPSYSIEGTATPDLLLACQSATARHRCYTPQQIQMAYDAGPLYQHGIDGAGRSIVIIDAFQSPTLRHDLHKFDQIFGLPDPQLNIYAPEGLAPFNQKNPTQVSWAAEITLDVEWAHAIAPGATINLVLANPEVNPSQTFSSFLLNMLQATRFAVENNLGDVISQSFGGNETCASPYALSVQHSVFEEAAEQNITLIAASGDDGAAIDNCASTGLLQGVSTPANDPLVTAVGGTTLTASAAGAYLGESSWTDSGGGFSTVYARPEYQSNVIAAGAGRGLPDVSYDANPATGVLVVWSSSGQGVNREVAFGGTSAGAPQWAGITALLDQSIQGRFGSLNPALYRIDRSNQFTQAFHDVTRGGNTYIGKNTHGVAYDVQGYTAGSGWDPVTGLGTPDIANLIEFLPQRFGAWMNPFYYVPN